jgi:hypoxanthine phosphoribosyltransferase
MEKDDMLGEIILTEKDIAKKVEELAQKINNDYAGKEIILIGILKSSIYFMTDLSRKLNLDLKIDFLEISHYADENDSGLIRVNRDLEFSISGKDVILIENIINTGLTHSYLFKNLKARNPKSLSICTLLQNKEKRLVELPIDYSGFEIKDKFVVGYGLDYKEKFRNLSYIAEYEL